MTTSTNCTSNDTTKHDHHNTSPAGGPAVFCYVYMHVCMYLCMYICIYIYIYTYVCIYIYIYTYRERWSAAGHRAARQRFKCIGSPPSFYR